MAVAGHLERPLLAPAPVRGVEIVRRRRRPRRVAADLVDREQHVVAVERRVLDALRLDRRRVLLQLHRDAKPFARSSSEAGGYPLRRSVGSSSASAVSGSSTPQEHDLAQEFEDRGLERRVAPAGAPDGLVDRRSDRRGSSREADVRAIDREAGDDLDERVAEAVEREVTRFRFRSPTRSSACASTFSSLASAVSMMSFLLS